MWKAVQGDLHYLYQRYREKKDNEIMAKKYPYNRDYSDRLIVISDELDIIAWQIANDWADVTGQDINQIITHLKSLCWRLYRSSISMHHADNRYLQHWYNPDTQKWMYREGTTTTVIKTAELNNTEGAPLLHDLPSNLYEGWQ